MSINKKRKEKYEPIPSEIAKLGIKPYMLYDDYPRKLPPSGGR